MTDGAAARFPIPSALRLNVVDVHGADGAAWLERLPSIVDACERLWGLRVGAPFEPLSFNFAAPALLPDGSAAVLKLGPPGFTGIAREAEALRCFDGRGCARLLGIDLDLGALLIERLQPGMPLAELDDDAAATSVAAGIMRRLQRPAPVGADFPSVADWFGGFQCLLRDRYGGGTGPLPPALVQRAERTAAELLADPIEPALLHGDLHHTNILAAGREPWLAIDPKGVTGDPVYETVPLLYNPWPRLLQLPDPAALLTRRIVQFSEELGFDRQRIRAWAFAGSTLSAVWCLDDHGAGWEYPLGCAELIASLRL